MLKYVFFGTPQFADTVLRKLISSGLPPTAIVCNPDRPLGRKQTVTPPPTKVTATSHEIPCFQPVKLSEVKAELEKINPDVFVVAAFAKIIPAFILAIPRLGTIGVHPSLLPKYRGASPIQSVLLAGETETGVTLYMMDERIDHGPMIARRKYTVENSKYYLDAEKDLAGIGADLLMKTLPKLTEGTIKPIPQDESRATFTKKFITDDGFVDEQDLLATQRGDNPEKAREVFNKMRALNPEPGVWTLKDGKRIKLLKAKLVDGKLELTKIQKEGRTPETIF